jgi:hypothetical protein
MYRFTASDITRDYLKWGFALLNSQYWISATRRHGSVRRRVIGEDPGGHQVDPSPPVTDSLVRRCSAERQRPRKGVMMRLVAAERSHMLRAYGE